MKLKMKNESRTSRMKSVGVLGNISGLGASIMSMDYDSDDDQAYCDCPEAKYFLDLQTGNGCLRGNSNSDISYTTARSSISNINRNRSSVISRANTVIR